MEEEVVEPRGEVGGNKEMGGEEREDKSKSRQQGGRGRIRELAEEARKERREAAKASLSAFEKALAVFLFQFNDTLHNILFHRIFQQTPLLPPKGKPPPLPRWKLSWRKHGEVH